MYCLLLWQEIDQHTIKSLLKLLIISSRFPYPLEKGDKLRLYYQIRELAKWNDITLVSVSDEEASESDKEQLKPYVGAQYHFDITKGVRLWNRLSALSTGLPIQVSQLYDPAIMKAIEKITQRHHIEHVYCQLPRAAEYARRLNLPKTIDYMDAFGESMEKRALINTGFKKKLFTTEAKRMRKYESKIFIDFDHHTLISEQDKSYMEISNPDLVHVVPNGIDTEFFSFGLTESSTSDLAFIGNMGYPPNEAAAVYIHDNILPLVSSMTLTISGARPTPIVQQLASKRVTIVGWVDDIREAYRSAKVFVAPIFSGTGQQNKILESMAIGLPSITTTQVNNAIGAADGKEILIADNPQEFAKAIEKLLNDDQLYRDIQQNARTFVVEYYSWKEHVAKLNKIIQAKA